VNTVIVSIVFSAMEEEELQVALAISASLNDQGTHCYEEVESSRLDCTSS